MSTTLSGDIVRVARYLVWNHATIDALLDASGTHDSRGIVEASAALRDALRLQDALGWLHEPLAATVNLDDEQASALGVVLVEALEAWSENAAKNPDDPETSQRFIRDASRALHAVTPAA